MDTRILVNALLIIVAGGVLYWLVSHYQTKQSAQQAEKFYQDSVIAELSASSGNKELPYVTDLRKQNEVGPSEETIVTNSEFKPVDFQTSQFKSDCFPKDRITAADLLPKDAANSKWSVVNPAGQGDISDQNFLTAGFHQGIDTVGSSLRNANLQLRSEPPVKKGEWPILNSTIEPDLYRKPLDAEVW